MNPPVAGLLYLPALIWAGTGIGLIVAFRRSAPTVVLRLAAVFLALWALLATTLLVWVLENGGLSAVARLAAAPWLLFGPRALVWWTAGAAGALLVLAVGFSLNQLVGRGLIGILRPRPLEWPAGLPHPMTPTSILRFDSPRIEAFSFTLLQRRGRSVVRHELILVSEGALERFDAAEVKAAIAHELSHIVRLDGRYLTFVRTLSRMMRWDPVLAYLAHSLTRREEFGADDAAVRLTGNPLALARALFKAMNLDDGSRRAAGLLGTGGRRGRRETVARIQRLVALAEAGGFVDDGIGGR